MSTIAELKAERQYLRQVLKRETKINNQMQIKAVLQMLASVEKKIEQAA